ncbi:hypothetical protein SMICM17S_02242 [Streptomyces microflavus]
MACVSTTDPAPSPSMMCMTTVRGSGAVNRARTGTTSRPATLKDTSTVNPSSSAGPSAVESAGVPVTVRSTKEYGWNHAPCHGSRRLATTSSGSQRPTPA